MRIPLLPMDAQSVLHMWHLLATKDGNQTDRLYSAIEIKSKCFANEINNNFFSCNQLLVFAVFSLLVLGLVTETPMVELSVLVAVVLFEAFPTCPGSS